MKISLWVIVWDPNKAIDIGRWSVREVRGNSAVGYGAGLVTKVRGTNLFTAITFSCATIHFVHCVKLTMSSKATSSHTVPI